MTTKHTATKQTGKKEFHEYYVVFQNSDSLSWFWKLFTRKGFEHCSILMANSPTETLNLNQSLENVRIYVYKHNVHDIAETLAQNPEYTVLYVPRVHIEKWRHRLGVFIPTCTSLCMRTIGLTSHAVTPYYYYKFLLKSGGQIMGGAPKVDNTAAEEARKEREAAKQREADEKARQEDLQRRMRLGRRSLLGTEGGEQGLGTS